MISRLRCRRITIRIMSLLSIRFLFRSAYCFSCVYYQHAILYIIFEIADVSLIHCTIWLFVVKYWYDTLIRTISVPSCFDSCHLHTDIGSFYLSDFWCIWISVFCIMHRLFYFDVQFCLFSEGNQWQSIINPLNVTFHTNWYSIHRAKFGNEGYLVRRAILYIASIPSIVVILLFHLSYTQSIAVFIDFAFMQVCFCERVFHKSVFFIRVSCHESVHVC